MKGHLVFIVEKILFLKALATVISTYRQNRPLSHGKCGNEYLLPDQKNLYVRANFISIVFHSNVQA